VTIREGIDDAHRLFVLLANLDIDMNSVTAHLLRDGVKQFADSFDGLMRNIQQKCEEIAALGSPTVATSAVQ
jgi:hypothetical protein